MKKHNHYFKDVEHLKTIDVYRVLELFNVADPCLQHAIKKLLVAGNRGVKNIEKDVQEAIDSLERWKEMRKEEKPNIVSVDFSENMNYNTLSEEGKYFQTEVGC